MRELITNRHPGWSLPAPFYTSQECFDLDVDAIFSRHWLFVASEPELPEPGDYVAVTIGRYPVIVVRDDDDQVRAFHNVCRHRGSRLLNDESGSVGNIVCGYHRWTYATDGRLLHAETQASSFCKEGFGLKPVAVRSVAGLIFICLSDAPPADFDEVVSAIEPYLAVHDPRRTKVAARVDVVEEGNWKLVMENNRECYHCDGHPELICSLFPLFGYSEQDLTPRLRPLHERYQAASAALRSVCGSHGIPTETVEELDTRITGFRVGRLPLDHAGESFSKDGSLLCTRLLGDVPSPRLGHLSVHMQPNSWFHFVSDHIVTFSVLPLGPDRTLLRTTWLVHADAIEGTDYDIESLTHVWRATNDQDRTLVARTQLGVTSPAYAPGPYSQAEGQVEAFVNWYIGRLRAHGR